MLAPDLKKHSYIEPWEPLVAPNGQELAAHSYEREDGLRHLYFWSEGEDIRGREFSRDVTRVGYRVWPDGVQLAGMAVALRLRGMGVGQQLLEYFMDKAEAQEGQQFVGTGLIHKPLIALALNRAGLEPVSEDCLVEILPKSALDPSHVPKVQVVHQGENCGELVSYSQGGSFFDVVPPEEVITRYPMNDPGMTVALHTEYTPDGTAA